MSISQINLVPSAATGNIAMGTGNVDPGKIRGALFHPSDQDLYTFANNATKALRQTALQNALITAAYGDRAFFVHKLDAPTDNGEKVAYETRDQLKKQTDKGTFDKTFTVECTWAEYQMIRALHKRGNLSVAFIDENYVLWHQKSDTGIIGMTIHELTVPPHDPPETGKAARYYLRIALSNIDEMETAYHTDLQFNPFNSRSGLLGVNPWVLEDVTPSGASAGVFHFALKSPNGQRNLVPDYAAILNAAGAWVVVNPSGAAITITSVNIHTTGTEKDAFILTLDTADTDYNATDVLTVKLAALATLAAAPYNIKYAETEPIPVIAS